MKTKLLLLLALVALPFGLVAMDFGFSLSSDSSLSFTPDMGFTETGSLMGWIKVPFSEELTLEGSVFGRVSGGTGTGKAFVDLGTFYLSGGYVNLFGPGTKLEFEAGRVSVTDPTGLVIRQSLDGFSVGATWPTFQLGFSLGGTGLLFRESAMIIISQDDLAGLANTDPFALASSRLAGLLSVKFAELVYRQDLDFFVGFQFDFNGAATNLVHSQFIGLKASGPIGSGFYYDIYGVLNTMENSVSGSPFVYDQGLLLGANVSFAGIRLPILRAELGVMYTSGDTSPFGSFRPLTRFPLAWILPVTASDVGIILADISLKPVYGLVFGLKGRALFRTSAQPLDVDGFDPAATAWYLGTEASFYMDWLLASDFRIGLTAGAFIPNTEGAFLPAKTPDFSLALAAKLNL